MQAKEEDPATRAWRLDRTTRWLLVGILLLAIGLRVWGINYGLPYLYDPDEHHRVVRAQQIFKTGDLNPHYFLKPSLFIYLNALSYVPYYVAGKVAGVFHNPADIAAPIVLAMGVGKAPMRSPFFLGRGLTAAFGVGGVALMFLAGRQLTGRARAGLLGALMMAVSPTAVYFSHFIRSDIFMLFFALLSLWACIRVFQQGRTRDYLLAGVAAGLAASSKYPGALILLALPSAHLLGGGFRSVRDRWLLLGLAVSVLAFLATTPFALLDHRTFLADILSEAEHYATGHPGMEGDAVGWYLSYLWQLEGVLPVLAALEMVRGAIARDRRTIFLSLFPVAYFGFISLFAVRNGQTLLPLLPSLWLLALSLVLTALAWAQAQPPALRKLVVGVMVAILVVSLGLPLARCVKSDRRLTTVDSRETARVWIDQSLPQGSRIALESYAPYIDPQHFAVQAFGRAIDQPPDWYADNGFDYLLLSEGMFGRFYREPERYANEIAQYDLLSQRFETVKLFTDGGYEVRILAVHP